VLSQLLDSADVTRGPPAVADVIKIDEYNQYHEPTLSHGECTSDDPVVFLVLLISVHLLLLIFGNYLCYKARNVSTSFNEGKYIGFAIVNYFQSTLLSFLLIPLVVRAAAAPTRDSPAARPRPARPSAACALIGQAGRAARGG